jgi:hypothetical protein
MLEACYEFLKTARPFRDWNLPDGEDVKFIVCKMTDTFAQYRWDGKRHTISVSSNAVGHTATLVRVMSHELIHLHLEAVGIESRGTVNTHNRAFRKFAALVCRYHGFDPKAFY